MESFRSWPFCLLFMHETGKWTLLWLHQVQDLASSRMWKHGPGEHLRWSPRAHVLQCMPSPAEWQRRGRLNSELSISVFVPSEHIHLSKLQQSLQTTHSVWRTCFRQNKHPVFSRPAWSISVSKAFFSLKLLCRVCFRLNLDQYSL